jgi:spectinomycin phosphotransferase
VLERPSLPTEHIIRCLGAHYGIEAATLTFLALGADVHASVYKVEAEAMRAYFVKIKRGYHHDIGPEIICQLHDTGIPHLIPPVKTIHGQLTQRLEEFTVIVYPFIEGQDGFNRHLTESQWVSFGEALRRIHDFNVPLPIQNHIRREAYLPRWRKIVRKLLDDVNPAEFNRAEEIPAGDEIASKLLEFMKENMPILRRLVDRAEQLGQKAKEHRSRFVLCHSDIHAGNLLVQGEGSFYIVDWDNPIFAPKERDLMFIGGGVANVWNDLREEELFYLGYGNTEIDKTVLAYYRHERIVEDIAEYGQELLLNATGGENRQLMYKQFMAMFEPRGVVDIAFGTDVLAD